MSGEFSYLAEKVRAADFSEAPFRHVTIERFLSTEHFARVTDSPQVNVSPQTSHRALLEALAALGYAPQEFPGCITNVGEYVKYLDGRTRFKRRLINGYGRNVISGYGVTMRLSEYRDPFLADLVDYLNGMEFQSALRDKFGITDPVEIETAIQKNLTKYEISPHCDTSRKALTYMVNIYTDPACEGLDIHTHLLEFTPRYHYVREFWRGNPDVDPVWVPWHWCETRKRTSANNSVTIFRPSFDTLHAVWLDYDHLRFQRNQIYGNLWYERASATKHVPWQALNLTQG